MKYNCIMGRCADAGNLRVGSSLINNKECIVCKKKYRGTDILLKGVNTLTENETTFSKI